MKKRWILAAVLVVFLIGGSGAKTVQEKPLELALSQRTYLTYEKDSLAGLEGFCVLVETLSPEVEKLGLTERHLQVDTKLRLRQYSIRILSQEESHKTPGAPNLCVNVGVDLWDDKSLVFFI